MTDVQRRDLPAEEAVEQHQRDLVDHRRRDQEREGDAQRDARLDEADEQRHGRAAAERRDDAEARGHHVACRLAPAVQQGARPLRAEERAHEADAEDDDREQHEHLHGVVDEELERGREAARAQVEHVVEQPRRDRQPEVVDERPRDHPARHARPERQAHEQTREHPVRRAAGRRAGRRSAKRPPAPRRRRPAVCRTRTWATTGCCSAVSCGARGSDVDRLLGHGSSASSRTGGAAKLVIKGVPARSRCSRS